MSFLFDLIRVRRGRIWGLSHFTCFPLSFAGTQQQYIKEANLLRMIMSYKTCHDATSSSPHAVVNDVCLLLLSGQWTNLSSVISCSIYIIVPCSRDMDITHYVISLSIVMARRFNVICFSYMTSLWTFCKSGIWWKGINLVEANMI